MSKGPGAIAAASLGVGFLTIVVALGAGASTDAAVAAQQCGGPGGPAQQVESVQLTGEQLANARTIVTVTAAMHVSAFSDPLVGERAATIAVATSMQEATLVDVAYGDRDSLGLFQQRPSQGWGTPAQILNPGYATNRFVGALVKVPGWQTMELTVAAQAVQRSGYPGAYARWEALATQLTAKFWPLTIATAPGTPGPPGPGTPPLGNPAGLGDCSGGDGTGTPGGQVPGQGGSHGTSVPAGYLLPTDARQAKVVGFALAQLGKPYVWGGTGPDGWDCSGLMMRAWATVGVALPRTTYVQVTSGSSIADVASMTPGDLIFIAGSDGTVTNPGHVGMFIGSVAGVPYLVHAPHTGVPVQIAPVSDWAGDIVAIRRPG